MGYTKVKLEGNNFKTINEYAGILFSNKAPEKQKQRILRKLRLTPGNQIEAVVHLDLADLGVGSKCFYRADGTKFVIFDNIHVILKLLNNVPMIVLKDILKSKDSYTYDKIFYDYKEFKEYFSKYVDELYNKYKLILENFPTINNGTLRYLLPENEVKLLQEFEVYHVSVFLGKCLDCPIESIFVHLQMDNDKYEDIRCTLKFDGTGNLIRSQMVDGDLRRLVKYYCDKENLVASGIKESVYGDKFGFYNLISVNSICGKKARVRKELLKDCVGWGIFKRYNETEKSIWYVPVQLPKFYKFLKEENKGLGEFVRLNIPKF
jgi:hypothetical protein